MDNPITLEQAAHDASIGANDSLWQACRDAAIEGGYYDLFRIDTCDMCERAIRSMSKEQRALYFTEKV